MLRAWISLLVLLPGACSFMIYNTHHSLCLEDSSVSGLVELKNCNLDSELQQWVWTTQRMLKCVSNSRCLSTHHADHVQTVSCDEQDDRVEGLIWDCEGDRLISQNRSLELSTNGKRLSLSHKSKETSWRSVEEGDICKESLRSKRASNEPEEFEVKKTEKEEQRAGPAAMTDEQREFLRWYYRTEDPTPWKFAMLALSFACLLIGFLLLGMGSMANKNRKKIAKYKAAAASGQRPEAEELLVITEVTHHKELDAVNSAEAQAHNGHDMQVQGNKPSVANGVNGEAKPSAANGVNGEAKAANGVNGEAKPAAANGVNGEAEALKAGDIVVTWKDGNVSNLYSDSAAELEEEQIEQKVEEKEDEVELVAETDAQVGAE